MGKKKILRVCHKFLKDNDGYDIGIQDMVDLLKNEFENYVIIFLSKNELKKYISKNNLIKVKDFYYSKKKDVHIIPIFYEKKQDSYINDLFLKQNIRDFKKSFKEVIKKVNPDILHIHGTLVPQFLLAAKIGKSLDKKVIITHHIGPINKNYIGQKKSILFCKFFIHNLIPFFSDKIICMSNYGKKSFLFKKKIEILYGIKDIKKFPIKKSEINYLISKKVSLKDNLLFLYPGRYCKQKNQEILLDVFNNLIKENLKVKLIFAGNISDEKYFKKIKNEIYKLRLEEHILALKELKHKDLLKIMNASDFVILPSINENISRAGLEAMSLGVPILASKGFGHSEYIKEEINGLLFNPYDTNSILMTIKKAIKTKDKFLKSKNKLKDRYINKLLEIYHN